MTDATRSESLTEKSKPSPVDEKDNSFDAEFSLLEYTLTELKEDEHLSIKSDQNQDVSFEGLSDLGLACAKHLEIEVLKEAPVSNKSSNTSNSCHSLELPEDNSIILSGRSTSSYGEETNFSISSTSLLFKSTDKIDNVTHNQLGSLKHSVHTISKSLSSSCKNSVNYLAQEEINILNINLHDQTDIEDSEVVIVTQCDSSSEEDRKVQHTEIESNILSSIESIIPQNMDLSCEGKDCDLIKVTNINAQELTESDVLNLECSPIPSPCDPNLTYDAAAEETHEIEEQIKLSVDDHITLVDQNLCNAGIKAFTDQNDMIESDSLRPVDKSIDKSKENNDFKNEKNTIHCNFQAESEENLSSELDHGVKEKIENKTNTDVILLGEEEEIKKAKMALYCSTPVASKEMSKEQVHILEAGIARDFGQMSPLQTCTIKNKHNRKRKHFGLECIKEVDEDASYVCIDKRIKNSIVDCKENLEFTSTDEQNISSSMPCFEPPAKSILKKWLPSCLSRNPGTSFLILDECGESDVEESTKSNHDFIEPPIADDFEVVFKSLTEELMKSSSNIETLEKYHSQVQLESQMDNEKFDEVVQELTSNYDLGDKTSLSIKTMDQSALSEINQTCLELDLDDKTSLSTKKMDQSTLSEINQTCLELKQDCLMAKDVNMEEESFQSSPTGTNKTTTKNNISDLENKDDDISRVFSNRGSDNVNIVDGKSNVSLKSEVEETNPQTLPSKEHEQLATCSKKLTLEGTSHVEKLPNQNADGKGLTMDEEDFLLEDNASTKNKPYVFFEFVSSDPKENEDNYNPEWQKLGRLTSDEERYKAVRDRWRSLVPPDPNRDLTCRQWREKNRKPPLNIPTLNNNHQMHEDNERNQLCTAVFEMKIRRIVQDLENSRMNIMRERNIAFQELALEQDEQQRLLQQRILTRRGGIGLEMANLHKHHIEECCQLKDQYDLQLKQLTRNTEDKLRILKEAKDEVLMFQKFYKGVGSDDDEVCLYMTDIQVQELMETEDMLEQYAKFYK